ncbi:hypothetical protein NL676_000866 [Syzygium grande]|nr:hypothetical protein NL676_000866 [Syzygium grande]
MLIRRGTNSKIKYWKNKDGKSPLYLAVEICKICDSNPKGWAGRFLSFSCENLLEMKLTHSFSTFEKLLGDTWPDLADIKNNDGQNILHVTAKAGNDYMAQKILKARSKRVIIEELVNSEDVRGNTPLHLASMRNHCDAMRSLMSDKRSDLQLVNNDGLTALDMAMESGSLSMKNPAVVQFWLRAVFTLN